MRTLDRKTICGIKKWYTDAMAELSAEYNAMWEKADGDVDAILAANAWYWEQEDKLRVEYWERVERALDEASEKTAPAEREESEMKKETIGDVLEHFNTVQRIELHDEVTGKDYTGMEYLPEYGVIRECADHTKTHNELKYAAIDEWHYDTDGLTFWAF